MELKSLRAKVDLLEAKDLKQEEKIIKLEEKIDAKLLSDRLAPVSFSGERAIHPADNEMNQVDGKQNLRIDGKENKIINSVKLDDSDNSLGALNELNDSAENKSRMNLIFEQKMSNRRLSDDSSPRAIAPSSCRELSLLGHSLDGLYLVQNVDTNKIETVLCDFGTSRKNYHTITLTLFELFRSSFRFIICFLSNLLQFLSN